MVGAPPRSGLGQWVDGGGRGELRLGRRCRALVGREAAVPAWRPTSYGVWARRLPSARRIWTAAPLAGRRTWIAAAPSAHRVLIFARRPYGRWRGSMASQDAQTQRAPPVLLAILAAPLPLSSLWPSISSWRRGGRFRRRWTSGRGASPMRRPCAPFWTHRASHPPCGPPHGTTGVMLTSPKSTSFLR